MASFIENDRPQPELQKKLGGDGATFFVYAMEAFDNMAFVSITNSLVTYFYDYMNFSLTKSATTFTNFAATTYILTLIGGFISDTYLSRFTTSVLFSATELLGYVLLALQAHFSQLRPIPCKDIVLRQNNHCQAASSGQEAILYIGIYLVALGNGGVKATLPALGAEQYDDKDPKEAAKVSNFFNWFLYSLVVGSLLGVTFVAWITTNKGWNWGFGACAISILLSILFACMGKPFYRNNVVRKGSPLLRLLQVLVVSIKNRNLPIPEQGHELHEVHDKNEGSINEILRKTNQFKFLDRATVTPSSTRSETTSIRSEGPWNFCTTTQVEETKIVIRLLPVFLSTIFMNTCLAQLQTFSIQQGRTLDSHIGSFQVPTTSIQVIPLLSIFVLIPLYDRIFVPAARKITGIPTGIRHLQRIGIGLVLSIISMVVAGFVETHRRNVAIQHNLVDTNDPLPMSLFWLGFQFGIFGAADMFTLVGMLEFFHEQSSAGMKSLGTAISWCSFAFGFFISSLVVDLANRASGGWLASSNLNRDHLNYFFWLLSILSFINFGLYLICASWYKYKVVETNQEGREDEDI